MIKKSKDMYNVVSIGDIHLRGDSDALFDELAEIFLPQLTSDIDLLVIDGDVLDCQISFNDAAVPLINGFIAATAEICRDNDIKVRLMQGTVTHDYNQLDSLAVIFESLLVEEDQFMYHKTFALETIDGLDMLFLPEEYPSNYEEYYADIINMRDPVHCLFFHGTIASQAWVEQVIKSEKPHPSHVVWPNALLKRLSIGIIAGGHIHIHVNDGGIVYHGAFSSSHHGENKPKGFVVHHYNRNTHETTYTYIENTMRPTFQDINLDTYLGSIGVDGVTLSDVDNELAAQIATFDNTRFVISPETIDLYRGAWLFIWEKYRNDKRIEMKRTNAKEAKRDLITVDNAVDHREELEADSKSLASRSIEESLADAGESNLTPNQEKIVKLYREGDLAGSINMFTLETKRFSISTDTIKNWLENEES